MDICWHFRQRYRLVDTCMPSRWRLQVPLLLNSVGLSHNAQDQLSDDEDGESFGFWSSGEAGRFASRVLSTGSRPLGAVETSSLEEVDMRSRGRCATALGVGSQLAAPSSVEGLSLSRLRPNRKLSLELRGLVVGPFPWVAAGRGVHPAANRSFTGLAASGSARPIISCTRSLAFCPRCCRMRFSRYSAAFALFTDEGEG